MAHQANDHTSPSAAEKARVRMHAEARAKAAERERDEERLRDQKDPKTVIKAEEGDEPLDTRVAKTWGKVHEENEGERRERLLRERAGSEEFVPARRPLEEDDGDVAIDEADEPLTDRHGHRGGHA